MWHVVVGIYLIVTLVVIMFFWSSLVIAKKSDHKTDYRTHSAAD